MVHPETLDEKPVSIEIGPGATFPEWDAVNSDLGRNALTAILKAIGAETCWLNLQLDENKVRQAILHSYLSEGRAPSLSELAEAADIDLPNIRRLLQKLRARDLVVLSKDGERITGARFFEQNPAHSIEEMNQMMDQHFNGKAPEEFAEEPKTPEEVAQALCYQALDSFGRRRVQLHQSRD